jgi:hypothetical protein
LRCNADHALSLQDVCATYNLHPLLEIMRVYAPSDDHRARVRELREKVCAAPPSPG